MKVKILLFLGVVCFLNRTAFCLSILHKNNICEDNLTPVTSIEGILDDEFYQNLPTGPEKLAIDVTELDKNGLEEEREKENIPEFVVDEETIKNAEKAADKDLLSGLNRILKNNETLKDVFRTENVYEIP